jgi:hypothetical protein
VIQVVSILLVVSCMACHRGIEPAPRATAPALIGSYLVDGVVTDRILSPMAERFRGSFVYWSDEAPEVLTNEMGMEFSNHSLRVESRFVLRGADDTYPLTACSVSATVPIAWHGASFETAQSVVATSRFRVSDGGGRSIADTCTVTITAGRSTVERRGDGVALGDPGGRTLLVRDSKLEACGDHASEEYNRCMEAYAIMADSRCESYMKGRLVPIPGRVRPASKEECLQVVRDGAPGWRNRPSGAAGQAPADDDTPAVSQGSSSAHADTPGVVVSGGIVTSYPDAKLRLGKVSQAHADTRPIGSSDADRPKGRGYEADCRQDAEASKWQCVLTPRP